MRSLGAACYVVVSLLETLSVGPEKRVRIGERRIVRVRVKRFYIDEATERDEAGLVPAARWRLCDTRESAKARAELLSGGERGATATTAKASEGN